MASGRVDGVAAGPAADATLYRRVGAANLALAAGIDLLTGAALLALVRADRLTRIAFAALETYLAETALLREAPAIASATATGGNLAGVALVLVGAGAAFAAWSAFGNGGRRLWLPAGVCAGLNPLALPPAAVALALLYLAGRENEPDQ